MTLLFKPINAILIVVLWGVALCATPPPAHAQEAAPAIKQSVPSVPHSVHREAIRVKVASPTMGDAIKKIHIDGRIYSLSKIRTEINSTIKANALSPESYEKAIEFLEIMAGSLTDPDINQKFEIRIPAIQKLLDKLTVIAIEAVENQPLNAKELNAVFWDRCLEQLTYYNYKEIDANSEAIKKDAQSFIEIGKTFATVDQMFKDLSKVSNKKKDMEQGNNDEKSLGKDQPKAKVQAKVKAKVSASTFDFIPSVNLTNALKNVYLNNLSYKRNILLRESKRLLNEDVALSPEQRTSIQSQVFEWLPDPSKNSLDNLDEAILKSLTEQLVAVAAEEINVKDLNDQKTIDSIGSKDSQFWQHCLAILSKRSNQSIDDELKSHITNVEHILIFAKNLAVFEKKSNEASGVVR